MVPICATTPLPSVYPEDDIENVTGIYVYPAHLTKADFRCHSFDTVQQVTVIITISRRKFQQRQKTNFGDAHPNFRGNGQVTIKLPRFKGHSTQFFAVKLYGLSWIQAESQFHTYS